jgi:TIR domain
MLDTLPSTCSMVPCRSREEASGRTYDVFISHAGPQKANFAVWLQRELRRHGVSAFLDETSLLYCDAANAEMEAAVRSCSIVVFVLTLDFVRSTYCMEELHWALHASQLQQEPGAVPVRSATDTASRQGAVAAQTRQQGSKQPGLLPVFYHISDIDALQQDVERQIAEAHENGTLQAELPQLQQAGEDLSALYGFTGIRLDSRNKCVQVALVWLQIGSIAWHGDVSCPRMSDDLQHCVHCPLSSHILSDCRLDPAHVEAIVTAVLQRLDRPVFKAPTYAVDLDSRVEVHFDCL